MTIIPRVVVDQSGSVGHACYLVAVVPPGHDSGVLVCVLPQPIVRLSEVVQDVTGAVEDMDVHGGGRNMHIFSNLSVH